MAESWDLPLNLLLGCSRKRQGISSGLANPHIPPSMINKLGDDLLVEVLIRGLPNPRSVCRCKLVCKRWSSLISSTRFNRRFVAHHRSMNLNHPPMTDNPYELLQIIRSFLPPMPDHGVGDTLRVLDCNKELVLCCYCDSNHHKKELRRSYFVCNPFTKQWIALPLAPRNFDVDSYFVKALLVCEPRISNKLDLGDDQAPFVYTEYRFRVVRMFAVCSPNQGLSLDVFCSESGEWIKETVFWIDDDIQYGSAVSWNGELFWKYYQQDNPRNDLVARFNPFRPDMPLTFIDSTPFLGLSEWFISGAQGALHVIAVEKKTAPIRLSIWRLEEDGKSWRKQYDKLVVSKTDCVYKVEYCYQLYLHPHKPEIISHYYSNNINKKSTILCCDLRREELEFVVKLEGVDIYRGLKVFQPRVSDWPTPIPRYKELQRIYDGSYSFWVQSKSGAKIAPLPPSLNNW